MTPADSEIVNVIDAFLTARGERGATEDEMASLIHHWVAAQVACSLFKLVADGQRGFIVDLIDGEPRFSKAARATPNGTPPAAPAAHPIRVEAPATPAPAAPPRPPQPAAAAPERPPPAPEPRTNGAIAHPEPPQAAEAPAAARRSPPGTFAHGTSGYQRGCRCEVCQEARRAYNRDYMARRRANAAREDGAGAPLPTKATAAEPADDDVESAPEHSTAASYEALEKNLDAAQVACGRAARLDGQSRDSNPYLHRFDEDLRAAWFYGWDSAVPVNA